MKAPEQIEVKPLLNKMQSGLLDYLDRDPLMIGIHTGGVWLAEHLHRQLKLPEDLGTIDISFYRDDFSRIGINPLVKTSQLPVNIEHRHIILVDDVLHTGRTIRAAMNEIFDYGRPDAVYLAVLIERSGRELPIQPDIVGKHLVLSPQQHVKLENDPDLSLNIAQDKY